MCPQHITRPPHITRPKRITVTGSECTGKTTLAQALAKHYQTVWVPEFARQYVQEKGSAVCPPDVEAIAHGQIASEEAALAATEGPIIQDTDLLSTVVYRHHYTGNCPRWIEDAAMDRAADLYLLAAIDVPWMPDGDQRDRGDRREEMQALFRAALTGRGLDFVEVAGTLEERVERAVAAIDGIL